MKVTVDYEEVKAAIEGRIAEQLAVNPVKVMVVRIVRGKGENIYAVVDLNLDNG